MQFNKISKIAHILLYIFVRKNRKIKEENVKY